MCRCHKDRLQRRSTRLAPRGPHVEPVLYPRATTLETSFCCYFCGCSTIMATNLGPGPGPATLEPCGPPDSPQAYMCALVHQANGCSAPIVPVGTWLHVHMLPPSISLPFTHMFHCPVKPHLQNRSIKTKLLRITKQWQQSTEPSQEPL